MGVESAPAFGTLLRRRRTATGITQEALAERAGLSVRAISDLERGINRAPRKENVQSLGEALGLTMAERADWEAARRRLAARSSHASGVRHSPLSLGPSGGIQLRRPLTSLVAREEELAEITGMLTAAPMDAAGR